MNSLERSIINWCRLHPDNPDCQYILKGIHESKARKKAEEMAKVFMNRRQERNGDL